MTELTFCPRMGEHGGPCRHCSDEKLVRYTRVGVIKTGLVERRIAITPLGKFCNNDGKHFVRDLPGCPMAAALSAPLTPRKVSELEWMQIQMMKES